MKVKTKGLFLQKKKEKEKRVSCQIYASYDDITKKGWSPILSLIKPKFLCA
jgi:hypothetical protein